MSKKKKLVDLIHLDEIVNEAQLKADYQTRISIWERWMQHRQNDDLTTMNAFVKEQAEYYEIDRFLTVFLKQRLDWIIQSVSDPELRLKYLLVLPPFSQKGDLKSSLLHFFQLKNSDQLEKIVFQQLNKQERELCVLWDMYKLTKTLETIQTLKKWLTGRSPFNSHFSGKHALQTLNRLQESLNLLFQVCIKKEHQSNLLKKFPKDLFRVESVLKRREAGHYFATNNALNKFEYRNYLFFIYYKSNIMLDFEGQNVKFEINYLDYEIIRQEFLIYWISQRLRKNPRKQEVLEKYMFGRKTFAQTIEHRPDMEINLLKRLPKNVFDDLISQVNESVEADLKLSVDPMSENFGDFARQLLKFETAKELARKSIQAIQKYIIQTKKKKAEALTTQQNVIKPPETAPLQKKQSPEFGIQTLKESEISIPFFCSNNAHFTRLLKLLRIKLEPTQYNALNAKIEAFLNQTPKEHLIIKRSPRHERVVPLLINEVGKNEPNGQLLILGAELKNRQLGMGFSSKIEQKYEFHSYFVYGTQEKIGNLGFISEERNVKGEPYYIYDFSHPKVIREALKLIDVVTETQND